MKQQDHKPTTQEILTAIGFLLVFIGSLWSLVALVYFASQ